MCDEYVLEDQAVSRSTPHAHCIPLLPLADAIGVTIDGGPRVLELERHSLRSPDFVAYAQYEVGGPPELDLSTLEPQ